MRTVLNLRVPTTVASPALGDTLDLGAYANASGTLPTMLKLSWVEQYRDGTWTSLKVQHSDDDTTYADLWDLGTLAGDQYKYFYTWKRYLAILHAYTQGTTTADPGARFQVIVDVYGQPCWRTVRPCRREHLASIMPTLFEGGESYPDQMASAKMELELALRGRGVDPDKLLTDGHSTEPCIPGLEMAGAYKTLLLILTDAKIVRSETWKQDMEWLSAAYQGALDTGTTSGLATYDRNNSASPDREAEAMRARVRVRR